MTSGRDSRKAVLAGAALIAIGILANRWLLEALGANSIESKGSFLIAAVQATLIVAGIVLLARRPVLEHPTRSELILLLGSLVLTLGGLEVAARYWLEHLASEGQRDLYLAFQDAARSQLSVTPHHYLIYYPTPNYRRGSRSHNSLGYRNAEFPVKKPAGTFRIVAVGGSTTYTAKVWDNDKTFTAQLENLLRKEYGHSNVEVINAGVGGYGSAESLINLEFRVLDLDPDLIIVYHGTNDVHTRFVDPATYRGDNSGRRKPWQAPRVPPWERSTLFRILSRKLGVTRQLGLRDFITPPSAISPTSDSLDVDARMNLLSRNPPIYFERNLRNMVAVSREHGVNIMFATWAYSPLLGGYAATDYYQRGYREANDVVRQVAESRSVSLFDFAAQMPADPRYWADGRHVNEAGAELKAKLFARFLEEQHLIR